MDKNGGYYFLEVNPRIQVGRLLWVYLFCLQ